MMPEKKFWRCNVCNDIHYGAGWPDPCPTCNTKKAYVEITKEEAKKIMKFEYLIFLKFQHNIGGRYGV